MNSQPYGLDCSWTVYSMNMTTICNDDKWFLAKAEEEANATISGGELLRRLSTSYGVKRDNRFEKMTEYGPWGGYLWGLFDRIRTAEWLMPEQGYDLESDFVTLGVTECDSDVPVAQLLNPEKLRESRRTLLYGAPGSGKTCFARKLVLELANEYRSNAESLLPVYLQLRDWTLTSRVEEMSRKYIRECGDERLLYDFRKMQETGHVTFVLDGLDEVREDLRDFVVRDIACILSRSPGCRCVVTARNGTTVEGLKEFSHFELAPLSEAQIHSFVANALPNPRERDDFWSGVIEEPICARLASRPFFLGLILARYRRHEMTPRDIGSIIFRIVDALTDEWDASRGILRSLKPWATPERKQLLLRRIAHMLYKAEKTDFGVDDFLGLVNRFAEEVPGVQVLHTLEEHTGLIVHKGENRWAFVLDEFRDFFTAEYLVEKPANLVAILSGESPTEAQTRLWRLFCGLTSDATEAMVSLLGRGDSLSLPKALLLTEGFSQRLSTEKAWAELAATYIARALLSVGMERAVLQEVESESADNRARVVRVSIFFEGKEQINRKNACLYCELIKAIHRARDSFIVPWIVREVDLLSDSAISILASGLTNARPVRCQVEEVADGYVVNSEIEEPIEA